VASRSHSAFTFGDNWLEFSATLDAGRVTASEESVRSLLQLPRLDGLTFLDVGAGSGLFSIAALRLGAKKVVAIDRDPNCLAAIRKNVDRLSSREEAARIEFREGNVLEPTSLPGEQFDIVYAWGSLHHTGSMWQAVGNAAACVRDGGLFAVAIYNHTWSSPLWHRAKRLYHASPAWSRTLMVAALTGTRAAIRAVRLRHPFRADRGMSVWYDAVDWLGGLPYEYASSARVEDFLRSRGFRPLHRILTRRSGCNELVFRKDIQS
jgi:SAM-dependent methyltransferase